MAQDLISLTVSSLGWVCSDQKDVRARRYSIGPPKQKDLTSIMAGCLIDRWSQVTSLSPSDRTMLLLGLLSQHFLLSDV